MSVGYVGYINLGGVFRSSACLVEGPGIQMIRAKTFFRLAKKHDHHGFLLLPQDDKKYFCGVLLWGNHEWVTSDDDDRFMEEELLARIPKEYHDFVDVFMKRDADKFPKDRKIIQFVLLRARHRHLQEGTSLCRYRSRKQYANTNKASGFILDKDRERKRP
jgi:hypothetical protein